MFYLTIIYLEKMIKKIFNFLGLKKKKETPLISEFCLIKRTNIAKMRGIDDEENKIIEKHKNGEIVAEYPYSKSLIKSIKEVDGIPVIDAEDFEEDEEFFWEEPTEFGVSKNAN